MVVKSPKDRSLGFSRAETAESWSGFACQYRNAKADPGDRKCESSRKRVFVDLWQRLCVRDRLHMSDPAEHCARDVPIEEDDLVVTAVSD